MLKSAIKKIMKSAIVLRLYNRLNPKNIFGFRKTNCFVNKGALLRGVSVQIRGTNNKIIIGKNSTLCGCTIKIFGNNNVINIGDECLINNGTFWIEDDEGVISIGNKTSVNGKTEFACIEGTKIAVGEDCMFSSGITLRTGDSHSIVDMYGKRINLSKNIDIGNHVWIGADVICLKGVSVSDNTIIGAKSLLTKSFQQKNTVIAGNPATVIKENVDWLRQRI